MHRGCDVHLDQAVAVREAVQPAGRDERAR
jgi:hypothetical protein